VANADTERKSKIDIAVVLNDLAELILEKRAVWRCPICKDYTVEYIPNSYRDAFDKMIKHYRDVHDLTMSAYLKGP
jgi:predicted metal-binding protein